MELNTIIYARRQVRVKRVAMAHFNYFKSNDKVRNRVSGQIFASQKSYTEWRHKKTSRVFSICAFIFNLRPARVSDSLKVKFGCF